ncbi:MAG: hypothetical protein ACUVRT_03350 [Armatimonadota bacterium]
MSVAEELDRYSLPPDCSATFPLMVQVVKVGGESWSQYTPPPLPALLLVNVQLVREGEERL